MACGNWISRLGLEPTPRIGPGSPQWPSGRARVDGAEHGLPNTQDAETAVASAMATATRAAPVPGTSTRALPNTGSGGEQSGGSWVVWLTLAIVLMLAATALRGKAAPRRRP